MMRKYRYLKAIKIGVMALSAVAVFGWAVERLWNVLVPPIFGLRSITFLQALGLLLLSKILFGGFHRHGGGRHRWRRGMGKRWAAMTPEDRERFRAGLRGRGGRRCYPANDMAPEPDTRSAHKEGVVS